MSTSSNDLFAQDKNAVFDDVNEQFTAPLHSITSLNSATAEAKKPVATSYSFTLNSDLKNTYDQAKAKYTSMQELDIAMLVASTAKDKSAGTIFAYVQPAGIEHSSIVHGERKDSVINRAHFLRVIEDNLFPDQKSLLEFCAVAQSGASNFNSNACVISNQQVTYSGNFSFFTISQSGMINNFFPECKPQEQSVTKGIWSFVIPENCGMFIVSHPEMELNDKNDKVAIHQAKFLSSLLNKLNATNNSFTASVTYIEPNSNLQEPVLIFSGNEDRKEQIDAILERERKVAETITNLIDYTDKMHDYYKRKIDDRRESLEPNDNDNNGLNLDMAKYDATQKILATLQDKNLPNHQKITDCQKAFNETSVVLEKSNDSVWISFCKVVAKAALFVLSIASAGLLLPCYFLAKRKIDQVRGKDFVTAADLKLNTKHNEIDGAKSSP